MIVLDEDDGRPATRLFEHRFAELPVDLHALAPSRFESKIAGARMTM